MRILHWTESFHPRIGGTEIFVEHLSRAQYGAGHQCLVMTSTLPDRPEMENMQGVTVVRLPFHRPLIERSLEAIRSVQNRVAGILSAFRPDLIHLHTTQASAFYFVRLAPSNSPPAIYTAHDGDVMTSTSTLLRQIGSRVERMTAPSDHILETLHRLLPATADRTTRIHGSLPDVKTDIPPLPETPTLLALGRSIHGKGFDILLQAVPRIRERFPNLRVVLAGDGPEAPSLRRLADDLCLSEAIRFIGWTPPDEIPALMAAASVVVVPSRCQESFGLVALQAMQSGRAVIAARTGGLVDLVEHGHSGYLTQPDDPVGLADAILSALHDRHRLATLGINGRARAERLFSWQRCVASYQALYEETLSSTSSR